MSLVFLAPAKAQSSGVLLGIVESRASTDYNADGMEAVSSPRYQSVWVAPNSSGNLSVLATIPQTIVPRRDGFWHVGVKQICEFEAGSEDFAGGNETLSQVIWVAPVTTPGIVEQAKPCVEHKPEDYTVPFGRTAADERKITQCGCTLTDIESLSPEILSVGNYASQSESCEPRGGHFSETHHVRHFDSEDPLDVGKHLGAIAEKAYAKAVRRVAHEDTGEECGDSDSIGVVGTGWRIGRRVIGGTPTPAIA